MKNIFIIGNGFDLAHGYKTDYKSFVEYLIENKKFLHVNCVRNEKGNVVSPSNRIKNNENCIYFFEKENGVHKYEIYTENSFLKEVINTTTANNWCDIEHLYYELLKETKTPKKLNKEFLAVKKELEEYLKRFNDEGEFIEDFKLFFDTISRDKNSNLKDNLVMNFNYTYTFKRFYNDRGEFDVLDFHGMLNSPLNPIIFGYAPTEEQTKILIDKNNNNEYLKNIKRYYYKQTNNENRLNEFLEKKDGSFYNSEDVNVFIIGHSCGVSDRKILNEIFTNSNVKNINIMYYNDYNGYFDTLVNIDRVIGEDSKHGDVRNFELSLRSPQHDDVRFTSFKEDLKSLIKVLPSRKKKLGPVSSPINMS